VKRREWSQLGDREVRGNVRIGRDRVKERDQIVDGEAREKEQERDVTVREKR
jgi:hypothetical protein